MEEVRIEKPGNLLEEFEEVKKIMNENNSENPYTTTRGCNDFATIICC